HLADRSVARRIRSPSEALGPLRRPDRANRASMSVINRRSSARRSPAGMSTTTVSPSTRADTVLFRRAERRISILGSSGSVGSADTAPGPADVGPGVLSAERGAGDTRTPVDHHDHRGYPQASRARAPVDNRDRVGPDTTGPCHD